MAKKKAAKETTLVDTLRAAITNSGMTCYEISKASGVSQPQLSRFMSGERDLQLSTADKVCKVLGLKLQ